MLTLFVDSACFVSETVAPDRETLLSVSSVVRAVLHSYLHIRLQFVYLDTTEGCKPFSILTPDIVTDIVALSLMSDAALDALALLAEGIGKSSDILMCSVVQNAAGGMVRVIQAVPEDELKWQKGVNAVGTHVSLRKGSSTAELDGEIVKTLFEAAGYPVDEDQRSAMTAGG